MPAALMIGPHFSKSARILASNCRGELPIGSEPSFFSRSCTASVFSADDALAFAPLVECGLVVASEGHTRRVDLVRTIELLHKIPLVGTVLNRAADVLSGY